MSVIIRLQNLPMSANASNIRRFFSGLSIPEGGVHIVGGDDGDAFIAFTTDEDARKAMLLDSQLINNVIIRLFLSSKTEMQSVIESARNSIMFSETPVKQQVLGDSSKITESSAACQSNFQNGNQLYSQPKRIRETERVECRKPVNDQMLPNHSGIDVLSVRNIQNSNQIGFNCANLPVAMPVRIHHPVSDISSFQNYTRPTDDQSNLAMWNRGNGGYFQMPPPDNRGMQFIRIPDFGPPKPRDVTHDKTLNKISSCDASIPSYVTTEPKIQNQFLNLPNEIDSSLIRRSVDYDVLFRQEPPIKFVGQVPLDSRKYWQPPGVGEYQISASESEKLDTSRKLSNDSYVRPEMDERDFSIRPPWLREENITKNHLAVNQDSYEDHLPNKRLCIENVNQTTNGPDTEFVAKLSCDPQDVSVKAVFEILRGVNIIPKWGIRIEVDVLQRYTGHVYAMIKGRESLERAINCNGCLYHGKTVNVVSCSPDEFFQVADSNFLRKCPVELLHKLKPIGFTKPPYFADGCLELVDVPIDATESEVAAFIGAPGLKATDVVLVKTLTPDRKLMNAAVRLPSAKDLEILLNARPRPFRSDQNTLVRLNPISKMQFLAYDAQQVQPNPAQKDSSIKPKDNQDTPSTPAVVLDGHSCAVLKGFSQSMKNYDILKLFPNVIIPGDAVTIVGDGKVALVDMISENNCKKALADFSTSYTKIKDIHPNLEIKSLSRSELDRFSNNDSSDNTRRPFVTIVDQPPKNINIYEHRAPPREDARYPSRPYMQGGGDFDCLKQGYYRPPFEDNRLMNLPPDNSSFRRAPEMFPHPREMPYLRFPPNPQVAPLRVDSMRDVSVYISNLPSSATAEILMDIFRPYFPIPNSLRMRRDANGHLMGDAGIAFSSSVNAERALHELTGYRLHGRNLVLRCDRNLVRSE